LLHRLEQVIGTSLLSLEDRHLPHRRALWVAQALVPLFARHAARFAAACIVWRAGPADSMLARTTTESTSDAGYTTAGVSPTAKTSISFLPLWGGPYTTC
jgi:hypothetical protein